MAAPSLSRVKDIVVAIAYSAAIACCFAASGIMLALLVCNLGFDTGLIRARATIDVDDTMMIATVWGVSGGLIGFVAGALVGWRVIWQVKGRGAQGVAMAGGMNR